MPQVSVPWGQTQCTISLPEDWTVEQVADSLLRPAPEDWADRLALVLGQPGTGLSLEKLLAARPGGRIVVVVEDVTRHSPLPQILGVVMRELEHCRVGRERIEFVFATGMHTPMSDAQAAEKLGPAADGVAWRCNPWQRPDAYVSVGRCEGVDIQIDRGVATADLRILVSSVSPHLQAGFGGGYKMLIPGCASLQTIRHLHRRGLGRTFRQWVGTDGVHNPMRRLIDGAGAMIDEHHGASFALQYLLDEADLPSSVAAGDVLPTQRMLAKQCAVACGVLVNEPGDVVIANAHPRDFDLWQSFKCIPNTLWAARRDGVVICLTRCPAGVHGMSFPRIGLSSAWMRRLLRWLGPGAFASLVIRLLPQLASDAAFFVRLATQALRRNPIFMVSAELAGAGVRFPGVEIFPSPEPAIDAARAILGDGPQSVVVFPAGGITYPVPPGQSQGAP